MQWLLVTPVWKRPSSPTLLLRRFVRELEQSGLRFHVLSWDDEVPETSPHGPRLPLSPYRGGERRIGPLRSTVQRLLREHSFEGVLLYFAGDLSVAGLPEALPSTLPRVAYFVDPWFQDAGSVVLLRSLYQRVERATLNRLSHLLISTPEAAARWKRILRIPVDFLLPPPPPLPEPQPLGGIALAGSVRREERLALHTLSRAARRLGKPLTVHLWTWQPVLLQFPGLRIVRHPPTPHEQLLRYLRGADWILLTRKPKWRWYYSGKFLDAVSLGRPLLYIGVLPSSEAAVIQRFRLGVVTAFHRPGPLLRALSTNPPPVRPPLLQEPHQRWRILRKAFHLK